MPQLPHGKLKQDAGQFEHVCPWLCACVPAHEFDDARVRVRYFVPGAEQDGHDP